MSIRSSLSDILQLNREFFNYLPLQVNEISSTTQSLNSVGDEIIDDVDDNADDINNSVEDQHEIANNWPSTNYWQNIEEANIGGVFDDDDDEFENRVYDADSDIRWGWDTDDDDDDVDEPPNEFEIDNNTSLPL